MPYITASIIIQLLAVVIPRFEAAQEGGPGRPAKLTQYTRYLTIGARRSCSPPASSRSPAPAQLFAGLPATPHPATTTDLSRLLIMVLTMTAGTGVIMWLGELITDRGVGNGMSLLIFTSIAARFPRAPL